MSIHIELGIRIQRYRKMQNLSQESLARKSGIDRTYMCDIEKGNRNISLRIIEKISKALDINITKLLEGF
jgi:transcriptional regulator with XRE-family HTH domain